MSTTHTQTDLKDKAHDAEFKPLPPDTPAPAPLATTEQADKTAGGAGEPGVERPAGSKLTGIEIEEMYGLSDAEYSVLLRTVCKDAPREIAAFFMLYCKRRNLDPFGKQVYLWPESMENGKPKPGCNWNIVAGIDGMRSIASRSPYFRGQRRPVWEYLQDKAETDGIARFKKEQSKWGHIAGKRVPTVCESTIMRAIPQDATNRDSDMEFVGIARFDEFVKKRDGKIYGNWEEQPEHQLRIRAEAMALRMAFPEEVGGIYTPEELDDRAFGKEEQTPDEEIAFTDEERDLAKRAGWADAMLIRQFKRLGGNHDTLVTTLKTIVERTENSARAKARKDATAPAPPEPKKKAPKVDNKFATKPGTMTDEQRPILFGALGRRGITDRDKRLDWAEERGFVVKPRRGAPMKERSFKNLSEAHAQGAIDLLTVLVGEPPDAHWHDRVLALRCDACGAKQGHAHDRDCPLDETDEPLADAEQTRLV